MSVAGLLGLLFALAALLLLLLNLMQRRELRALTRLSKEIQSVSIGGRLDRRLDFTTDHPELAALTTAVNHLLARKNLVEPPAQPDGNLFTALGDRMHECVLVHGDSILYANPQFAELLGVERSEVVGRRLPDLVPPDEAELVSNNLRRALAGEEARMRFEVDLIGMQGQLTRLELSLSPTIFEGSQALLVNGVEVIPTQTVPSLTTMMAGNAAPRARARQALDSLGEALLTVDSAGLIDYANPAAARLLGADAPKLPGRTLEEVITLVDESDRRFITDPVQQALHGVATVGLGRRAVLLEQNAGAEHSVELTASPLRSRDNAANEIVGAVVMLHDVTELRGMARQMSYQATHDALTGLVNRRDFERRLAESLETARRGDQTHVLCYVDLDQFKAVNDSSGHQAGDAMLREVAKLMREAVRDSDTVARLGGDEFALLLVGCPLKKGRQIADDLVRAIGEHRFVWKDRIHAVGASIGIVELARDSGSLEEALAAADSACYVAKKQGGNVGGVAVYSARDEVLARHSGEIHWLRILQAALRDNKFRLYYQPIVPAHDANGHGPAMEVLVRLADERGEDLSPMDLVRAAERYRLMGLVDRWVVQTTLTGLGRGAIDLPPNRSLAINLSGQTVADAQFLDFVVDCFDQSGADPGQVCFEIAESAVAANLEAARRFVGVLHGMGSQFALDDFGRSLGSFSSLKSLPMDYLKIDGAFMRNLARDSVNQAMVTATIRLARSLNFKVIAEQVEDAAGIDAARSIGVDYLQGYAIARPMPLKLAA